MSNFLAEVFPAAVDLLSDKALVWFRAHKGHFRDYDDFIAGLERSFRSCDYELQLWEEMLSRTQGRSVKVILYMSAMEGLFRKGSQKVRESNEYDAIYTYLDRVGENML